MSCFFRHKPGDMLNRKDDLLLKLHVPIFKSKWKNNIYVHTHTHTFVRHCCYCCLVTNSHLTLFMGFPRQERNGLPFPSPGDLPDSGMEFIPFALAAGFFTTEPPVKPSVRHMFTVNDYTNKY